jgi:hypothetical protein
MHTYQFFSSYYAAGWINKKHYLGFKELFSIVITQRDNLKLTHLDSLSSPDLKLTL